MLPLRAHVKGGTFLSKDLETFTVGDESPAAGIIQSTFEEIKVLLIFLPERNLDLDLKLSSSNLSSSRSADASTTTTTTTTNNNNVNTNTNTDGYESGRIGVAVTGHNGVSNSTAGTLGREALTLTLHEVFQKEYKLIQDEINDRLLQSRLLYALQNNRITLVNSDMKNSKRNCNAIRPPLPEEEKEKEKDGDEGNSNDGGEGGNSNTNSKHNNKQLDPLLMHDNDLSAHACTKESLTQLELLIRVVQVNPSLFLYFSISLFLYFSISLFLCFSISLFLYFSIPVVSYVMWSTALDS